jgi:hypothetical protein
MPKTKQSKESRGTTICPRCANLGYIVKIKKGSNTYLYCYHYRIEGKRRVTWQHYLGPASRYRNIEKADAVILRKYLQNLLNKLDKMEPSLDKEDLLKWLKDEVEQRIKQNEVTRFG